MREKRHLLEIDRKFSPVDTSSSKQNIMNENALKDIPQRRSLRNKGDRSLAQEVKIINLDDLGVASLPNKRVKTNGCTTPSELKIIGSKKSSNGRHSQQRSEMSVAKASEPADVVNNKTKKRRKLQKTR